MGATALLPTRRLQASRGWRRIGWSELWRFRELLLFFVWRDIKVRYKQTVLGAAWAIIQPVTTMIVFTVFFGRLAHVPSDGLPYPVFSLLGLVPWTYFAAALSASSTSLGGYQHIISKVYFPRLIVPLAAVLAPLVDFAIAFAVLVALMAWYHVVPSANIVWLPALIVLAAATAGSIGIWLSALSVRYRDVRFVVPFAVQLWLFATPVAYPASLVPERWRMVYAINPMVGVIEGVRWVLADGHPPGALTFVSATVVAVTFVSGVIYFRSVEGTFADVI